MTLWIYITLDFYIEPDIIASETFLLQLVLLHQYGVYI